MIPASRQYDEDWNDLRRTISERLIWIPASRQYDEDWNRGGNSAYRIIKVVIPASRQYDEDWNTVVTNGEGGYFYSSQSPVWWGLKRPCKLPCRISTYIFQPVASMMRIETSSGEIFSILIYFIPASRQYDEDWNINCLWPRGKALPAFQPVASMMRIETLILQ